jgi:hypothetical protein
MYIIYIYIDNLLASFAYFYAILTQIPYYYMRFSG